MAQPYTAPQRAAVAEVDGPGPFVGRETSTSRVGVRSRFAWAPYEYGSQMQARERFQLADEAVPANRAIGAEYH